MEAGTILSADVLDIIFDNRNKEYGAYDLRKNYEQRLMKSLAVIFLLSVLICIAYVLLGSIKYESTKTIGVTDATLEKVKTADTKVITPPEPPKLPPVPVKMLDFTSRPIIEKNPPKDEMPPEQKDMENVKIGTANILEGADDDGKDIAPVDERRGIVDAPKKPDDDGIVVGAVEIESQYPGGLNEWTKFLMHNLPYPQVAIDNEIQGTVLVQFIVDKEGNVSDVTAVSGPEELYAAAIAAIKKSGKWTAAIQNGRKVKSYKRQPITFKLEKEG